MKLNSIVQAVSRSFVLVGIASVLLSVTGIRSLSTATRPAQLISRDPLSQINLRQNPSVAAPRLGFGSPGDRVEILREQAGYDGSNWSYVRFQQSNREGWIRSDFVQPILQVIQPRAIAPENPVEIATRPRVTTPRSTVIPESGFTAAQMKYFMEVAMGSEYGQEANPRLRKWEGEVRIQVFGQPTQADLATVQSVISEVNALVNGQIRLQLVDRNPNIRIHFAPESQFSRIEPAYVPVNYGFFVTNWNGQGVINRATVLINSTSITQKERSHLIREELTQSLGLMRDSFSYAESMFYQPWTDVTQFAPIDRAVIQMLYHPSLRSGMTKAQVSSVLNTLQAQQRQQPLSF